MIDLRFCVRARARVCVLCVCVQAVALGADAAMELGNPDKALKFYKAVLKYDPDQKEIKKQYGLSLPHTR